MKKHLFVFGTRPEAIKLAPLIKEFKKHEDKFETKVCVTAQHREMLDQVLDFFSIKPDYDLNLMKPNQTLFDITANGLKALEKVYDDFKPDNVFVQGDTTTVLIGALAAFYKKIKISHVEAGLRSHNKFSPFPEEVNRTLTGHMAHYHFAPTKRAVNNLKNENITENVFNVGNTVIDALFLGLDIIEKSKNNEYKNYFNFLDKNKRVILVTGHRRESFGNPFENICHAIKSLAENYPDTQIVYPVHLNPNVRKTVYEILKDLDNVHLIEPLDYPYLIWLMKKSYIVLTDSGGIQEEAPSLGKPVIVLRDVTERVEGIDAGTAILVGTDKNKIYDTAAKLLDDKKEYEKISKSVNPYGDGTTGKKIIDIINNL